MFSICLSGSAFGLLSVASLYTVIQPRSIISRILVGLCAILCLVCVGVDGWMGGCKIRRYLMMIYIVQPEVYMISTVDTLIHIRVVIHLEGYYSSPAWMNTRAVADSTPLWSGCRYTYM